MLMTTDRNYTSPQEEAARAAKVTNLVAVLTAQGATGDQVRRLDLDGRKAAEALAGVRPASTRTWEAVAQVLDRLAVAPNDPFAAFQ